MGGGQSNELNALGEASPHRAKLSFGKPAKGGFSAGPKTMEKIRTRSDFCLLKIVEQEVIRTAFGLWAKEEAAVYLEVSAARWSDERTANPSECNRQQDLEFFSCPQYELPAQNVLPAGSSYSRSPIGLLVSPPPLFTMYVWHNVCVAHTVCPASLSST